MPGIAGILGDPGVAAPELAGMVSCLVHEPSWRTGLYANDALGVHVGWATREGSFAADLPIWNGRSDVCLVFAGEDFMEPAEIRRLGGAGETQESRAGYLVRLYEALGPRFVEHLNGWFSGILIDLRQRIAVLFNDRFGLGRIYFHERQGRLYFASEAKSLLRVLPHLRGLDARGVAESLSLGCVLQNRTLFPGISLLPPGSRWTFASNGTSAKETYFEPRTWEQQPALADSAFDAQLSHTFGRVLDRYVNGRERVAASLTGGLDSRMIMAWARAAPDALPCYSFASMYGDSADVRIARRIARTCRQPHATITVNGEFMPAFGELAPKAVYVSDGAMDVTGAVELFVNERAAGIAPIRLTGNYGSEILRGNVAFRPGRWAEQSLRPEIVTGLRQAEQTYAGERVCNRLSFVAFKQVPWHHFARLAIEQSQLAVRSPFLDTDLVVLLYRAPAGRPLDNAAILRLVARGNADLAAMPTDRGDALPPSPIGKMRRSFRSLEIRAEYAFDYGMPQWLARVNRALAPLRVENAFLGRHKFYHFRVWYRDQLHGYARDVLLDPRARHRSVFTAPALERMLAAHASGAANWTREITRALTLELTYRTLIDR